MLLVLVLKLSIIRFHLDGIMQLKESYCIATNICSRKSATTFGDLPDWSSVPFLITYAYSNAKGISIYVLEHIFVFISKLGINSVLCIKSIDVTWWHNMLLLMANHQWCVRYGCNKCSLWLRQFNVIFWDKQSGVTMAVDLKPVRFCGLTINICVSNTLQAHPWNQWYAQGACLIIWYSHSFYYTTLSV